MKNEYVDFEEVKNSTDNIIEDTPKQSEKERKRADFAEMMKNEDFQRTFMRLHTPLNATKLPGRNDICPFCNSGKKFKNCDCYKTHVVEYRNKYFKD